MRELLGKVVKGHPELSLIPDPSGQQLLVPIGQRVPLPGPFAPGSIPLALAPRVAQSD